MTKKGRRWEWLVFLALVGVAWPSPQAMGQTGFDPRTYKDQITGHPTQVLVFGTMHLSGLDDDWDPATLEPVLVKLQAFAPDVIAIEDIDGMAIEERWEHRVVRGGAALRYGRETMLAAIAGRVGTGLGMAEAAQEARTLLENWPDAPAPAERRKLAALFATAGDPYSALVQWWSLDPRERTAGDDVGEALRDRLDRLLGQRNESSLIAAHLAQRLGLDRLYPMDSQGEDVFTEAEFAVFVDEVFPAIGERMEANADIVEADKRVDDLRTGQDVLDAYRMLNDPDLSVLRSDLEWLGMIDRKTGSRVGRQRLAGWETRNMRMAANIREASAKAPGGKVLVVVGAAHKPWLEAYLNMMSDVQIVDAEAVLRGDSNRR